MKNLLFGMMAMAALSSCQSKGEKAAKCTDECGAECLHTEESTVKTMDTTLSCKLTSPELRARKATVIAALKEKVIEREELPDGFSYRFDGSDSTIDLLNDFIKSERRCCDFFDFAMVVSGETATLKISGPAGVKEFINAELEL